MVFGKQKFRMNFHQGRYVSLRFNRFMWKYLLFAHTFFVCESFPFFCDICLFFLFFRCQIEINVVFLTSVSFVYVFRRIPCVSKSLSEFWERIPPFLFWTCGSPICYKFVGIYIHIHIYIYIYTCMYIVKKLYLTREQNQFHVALTFAQSRKGRSNPRQKRQQKLSPTIRR